MAPDDDRPFILKWSRTWPESQEVAKPSTRNELYSVFARLAPLY